MDDLAPLPAVIPAPAQDALQWDYSALDAVTARDARAVVARYRDRTRAHVIETGRDLIGIKDRLGHGHYLPWLRDEMGMTPRTAQHLMLTAKNLGATSAIVSHLRPTVMYKLAAAPAPVRESIVDRIERGEPVPPEAILREVKDARAEATAIAAAAREAARRDRLTDEQRAEEDALRARGARGQAARARKVQREQEAAQRAREASEADCRRAQVRSAEAGDVFVDALGPEWIAAYHDLYGDVSVAAAWEAAMAETHRRRARSVRPTEVAVGEILRGPARIDWLDAAGRAQVEARAAEIAREGLTVTPIVTRVERDGAQTYHPVEGIETIWAYADVLQRTTIPVRIVPPAQDVPLAALRPGGSRREILRLPTAGKDHFGEQRADRALAKREGAS